jgi:hypothetical protein
VGPPPRGVVRRVDFRSASRRRARAERGAVNTGNTRGASR